MITITAEQIERVNLILSGVPGGIEKALSSTIRRANNTVRSETLKGITTVYAITRQNVRRKRQSRSAHSQATAELLELSCLRATRYRYTASTYRRQFLSNGLPCRRRCLPETGARRFKTHSLRECKADIQVCSSATVQSACLSASSWGRLRHRWQETVLFLPTWRKRHKRSSTSALNTKSPAF